MLLVAMLVMVLATAAPAFAQATVVQFDGDDDGFSALNSGVSVGDISQTSGDQNAASVDESFAGNSANSFELDVVQFNSGFNAGFDLDDDGIPDDSDLVILLGDFDNNGVVDDFE